MPTPQTTNASFLLDRQQQRRDHGQPTLSVLSGPISVGNSLWLNWNRRRGVVVARSGVTRTEMMTAWSATVFSNLDVREAVSNYLTSWLGQPVEECRALHRSKSLYDLERLWDLEGGDTSSETPHGVCFWIASHLIRDSSLTDATLSEMFEQEVLADDETNLSALGGLASLLDEAPLPAILCSARETDASHEWFESAAGAATELVRVIPSLAIALVAPSKWVEEYLHAPDSHVRALVREGRVPVAGIDKEAFLDRLRTEGLTTREVVSSAGQLADTGLSPEDAAEFVETAKSFRDATSQDDHSKARSLAEQFLFDRLEELGDTTGLFSANERLEFLHGSTRAEADLVARKLKIAIELDGTYFHANDPESYRRDRRKDWAYQRNGYWVLRFLSEDVVENIDDILTTIREAVRLRRSLASKG